MADAHAAAAAQAPEDRLIILPVDTDDASVEAVSWAAKHVLRHGASNAMYPICEPRCGCGERLARARTARCALGLVSLC
jgi:hypothetical protein